VGGLFWVRLFILQHDCGHGSFFSSAKANRLVGAVLGVFTLTPFARWKASHAAHHATSGNLKERRWSRDIYLFTVDEFRAAPRWLRLVYRLYRNRLVLFFILAPLVFLFEHRRYTADETSLSVRRSVWITNIALIALGSCLFLTFDPVRLLQVLVPFYLLGAAMGVWLFYVQHQFAGAYWAEGDAYSPAAASLAGSSVLRLPRVLGWMTAHIGIHHIHHLAPRVPCYGLEKCDRENPELAIGTQFTLGQALMRARGDLWDPATSRLVTFAGAPN
jgi:omega-6 fatty acid desaturase (delta-12 desaturase)